MSKTKRHPFTNDFKKEAIRLVATSGRTLPQAAEGLGVELSSLSRWKQQFNEADLLADPHEDVTKNLRDSGFQIFGLLFLI